MESAEEFFREYLRDKAEAESLKYDSYLPLYEKYFTTDLLKYHLDFCAKIKSEEFVSIEINDETTRIITVQFIKDRESRYRYTLIVIEDHWKIYSKESECFVCRGSGRRGDNQCRLCGGLGWKDYSRNES